MHRFNKILVTDLDELIIPRNPKHMTYSDLLNAIDNEQPSNHTARNYVFRNDYFFKDFPQAVQEPNLITLRNQWRIPPSGPGYYVKSIIDPQSCTNMHNHRCWGVTKLNDKKGKSVDVRIDLGLSHHYKKCHFNKMKCDQHLTEGIEDHGMLRFKDKLVKAVSKQFKALKLDGI